MPQQPSSLPAGWEVVEESASAQSASKPSSALPDGWEVVEDTPTKSSGEGALAAGAGLAGLAAAVPTVGAVANRLANLTTQVAAKVPNPIGFGSRAVAPVMETVASPALQRIGAVAGRVAAPLNVGMAAVDYLRGKRSLTGAATQAAMGEGARRYLTPDRLLRAARVIQRGATPVAEALGGGAAAFGAGGLAGTAGTAAFLGALQHDANRRVDIDYSKNTPDTWIARVLGGRTADERMDDPNDPAFQPDDSATVRAAVIQGLR